MELTCISAEEVYLDGKRLDPKPSQKRHNHSPDGFAWGYGGSGPAQLALAVMMEMLRGSEFEPDYEDQIAIYEKKKIVKKHYQDFKSFVISALPKKPCAVEFDFWGWFNGNDAPRLDVRELDEKPEKTVTGVQGGCTFPEKCQKATWKDCDCACGGTNHGVQMRMFN